MLLRFCSFFFRGRGSVSLFFFVFVFSSERFFFPASVSFPLPIPPTNFFFQEETKTRKECLKNHLFSFSHSLLFFSHSHSFPLFLLSLFFSLSLSFFLLPVLPSSPIPLPKTTGNFIEVEYNAKTQGIWSQKFPWKDSQSPPTSDFEEQLVDYVPRLGIPADPEAALLDALRRGDFSSARADLVMSIPGNHRGEDYHRYGMGRLRSLLSRATGFADSLVGSQLVAQCSSLGTLTVRWAHDWIEAVGGGVTRSGAPLGYPRAGRGNGALPLSIVWPTVQQVAASVEGAALGGFGLFGSRAKRSRPAGRRRLVLWGGGPVPRTPAMPHIKTFCRVDHETGKIAWLYLGSGNFGPAAWGDSPMAGNGLASSTVSNWEVGVLLLPEREAAYRAHRHCGLNGDVAEGAARPPPATGARRVEFYAVGRAPTQAAADTDVVQLPLPYSLPPQRYRPGQDQPWVS